MENRYLLFKEIIQHVDLLYKNIEDYINLYTFDTISPNQMENVFVLNILMILITYKN